MIVLKFGGTSVSTLDNLKKLQSIAANKSENYVLVVSAFAGVTNLLEKISATSLLQEPTELLEQFKSIHINHIKDYFSDKHQTDLLMEVQKKFNSLEMICTSVYTLQELSDRTQAMILSYGRAFVIIYSSKIFID